MYCTSLHSTVLYCIALYCTVLYCIALYCTLHVLYCIALYCTLHVLYCTVLHCTVGTVLYHTKILLLIKIIYSSVTCAYMYKIMCLQKEQWTFIKPGWASCIKQSLRIHACTYVCKLARYLTWPHHCLTALLYFYMRACKCQLFTDEDSRRLPKRLNYCFSILASAPNRSIWASLATQVYIVHTPLV